MGFTCIFVNKHLPVGRYWDFKVLSAICFNLNQSKILSSGNGLTLLFLREDYVDIRNRRDIPLNKTNP